MRRARICVHFFLSARENHFQQWYHGLAPERFRHLMRRSVSPCAVVYDVQAHRIRFGRVPFLVILLVCFLCYSTVSANIVKSFRCERFEDGEHLLLAGACEPACPHAQRVWNFSATHTSSRAVLAAGCHSSGGAAGYLLGAATPCRC
jgi:hypothetical protein